MPSHAGEVVINSFVDSYEFSALNDTLAVKDVTPEADQNNTSIFEYKPHFHEWATALPGMICVSRKARNATFRGYTAAETATPVITCCACLGEEDMKNFYFAGVCRSKSVRPIDDGVGPSVDEFCKPPCCTQTTHPKTKHLCVSTRSHPGDWRHVHAPQQQRRQVSNNI